MKVKSLLIQGLIFLIPIIFTGCETVYLDRTYTTDPSSSEVNFEYFENTLSPYGTWLKISPEEMNALIPVFDEEQVKEDTNSNNTFYSETTLFSNDTIKSDLKDSANLFYENYSFNFEGIDRENIWIPDSYYVDEDWSPYMEGKWTLTDWGWRWDSDYPFGKITHHYGRWWYANKYGWVWSPGYKWASAWVSWINTDDLIGWYPISPTRDQQKKVNHGIWVFVNKQDFLKKIKKNKIVSDSILKTTLRKNIEDYKYPVKKGSIIYNSGPDVKEIEKYTGTSLEPLTLSKTVSYTIPLDDADKSTKAIEFEKNKSWSRKKPVSSESESKDTHINDAQKETYHRKTIFDNINIFDLFLPPNKDDTKETTPAPNEKKKDPPPPNEKKKDPPPPENKKKENNESKEGNKN